jgi:cytochrome c-type biogenesis protein
MPELIIPAFIAGLLTFLAPCTLPLVPAYLAFVGGASVKDLGGGAEARRARAKVFLNGLFFVLGFSVVFIILGVFAGTLGGFVAESRIWVARIGGILVILFGLIMLEVFSIPWLNTERKFRINANTDRRGTYGFSFSLGAIFGSGWTPCIGPVLGSVLVLAGTSATAASGATLLAVFSLGLAIPFLVIALLIGRAQAFIDKHSGKLRIVTKIAALLIIGLGLLLLTDKMNLLITYGYQLFDFINYDKLLDYL